MIFFKKKSDLTKKEEEIRTYILEEYARTVYYWNEDGHSIPYANGREK